MDINEIRKELTKLGVSHTQVFSNINLSRQWAHFLIKNDTTIYAQKLAKSLGNLSKNSLHLKSKIEKELKKLDKKDEKE